MEFLTRRLCCTGKQSCESRSCDHISTYQFKKRKKNVGQVPRSVTHVVYAAFVKNRFDQHGSGDRAPHNRTPFW